MRIAQSLEIPKVRIIVNKSPALFNAEMVKHKVEDAYKTDVIEVLPHSEELMALASAAVFALKYPQDALTRQFKQVTKKLME